MGASFFKHLPSLQRAGNFRWIEPIGNLETLTSTFSEYKKRWSIELLFSHLKKRGFNLEDTHMTQVEKVERLFGVVTLRFLATYSWGLMLQSCTQLNATEKRKSTFRLGLESLLQILDRASRIPDPRASRSELADRYLLICFLPLTTAKNVV